MTKVNEYRKVGWNTCVRVDILRWRGRHLSSDYDAKHNPLMRNRTSHLQQKGRSVRNGLVGPKDDLNAPGHGEKNGGGGRNAGTRLLRLQMTIQDR